MAKNGGCTLAGIFDKPPWSNFSRLCESRDPT